MPLLQLLKLQTVVGAHTTTYKQWAANIMEFLAAWKNGATLAVLLPVWGWIVDGTMTQIVGLAVGILTAWAIVKRTRREDRELQLKEAEFLHNRERDTRCVTVAADTEKN